MRSHFQRLRRLMGGRSLDGLLLVLLVSVAFLLGCYEMGDTDVWWHLRGGEWIRAHGRVPDLDPFTFGSADQRWVDIHWSYQVILALAYRWGGVGALVLLGATAGCGAFLAVVTARRREWSVPVLVLCWLPALVLLGFRLDPRPEIFSLLYLGCFLAVLWRVEDRPGLAWLLVPLQVLWVNVQGLFILGPILVGLFLAARTARLLWQRPGPGERRWWLHAGGAAVGVAGACLINPYFLDGARFPFDLWPKVADAGNIYKRYVGELMSPRDYVQEATPRVAGANWFFLSCYFLLLLLPLSFLWPALWQACPTKAPAPRSWVGGLALVIGLLAAHVLTLSGRGAPGWALVLGENVPLLLLAGALPGALLLRRSPVAAVLLIAGGVALAAWMLWLQATVLGAPRGVLGEGASPFQFLLVLVGSGAVAGALVVRGQGNLFRILVAGAFGYLALQALQNWSRFALVAGAVLSWNFAEWAALLRATNLLASGGREPPC